MQRASWFVMAALRGIARHVKDTRKTFNLEELAGWDKALKSDAPKARLAIETLCFHKMAETADPQREGLLRPVIAPKRRWKLTAKGLATCQSVLREQNAPKALNPESLSARLWALFRLRKMLTAEDAAATLVDAGAGDFAKSRRQIAAYLLAWSKSAPDVVKLSDRLVNGQKRYVMVKEGPVIPPPTKAGNVPLITAPREIAR